jgi:hypothetical protein
VTISRRVQKQAVPSIAESKQALQVLGSESHRLEVKDGVGFTEVVDGVKWGCYRKNCPGGTIGNDGMGYPRGQKQSRRAIFLKPVLKIAGVLSVDRMLVSRHSFKPPTPCLDILPNQSVGNSYSHEL